jgi:hypothetical protein
MYVVESYDREFKPLKANIGTRHGDSVEIYVQYEDGRWHRENWVDGHGQSWTGTITSRSYGPPAWARRLFRRPERVALSYDNSPVASHPPPLGLSPEL